LRPKAARHTNPEPSSISEAGSGTGDTVFFWVSEPVLAATVFEEIFDLPRVVEESSEGQPAIEKHTITTDKHKNNFFIFIP
jgi:hypothetical protein